MRAGTATRWFCGAALALSAACAPVAAEARTRFRISIAGGDLADSLATLSSQTGISLGLDGPIPRIAIGPVTGQMSAHEALERMLKATPLKPVRIGPATFALRPRKHGGEVLPAFSYAPAFDREDIVVTARKVQETLSDAPAPVSAYVPARAHRPGVTTSTHKVADAVEGLSVTSLGAGRERLFIRGVADSPFNGFSQSTVSVQMDDARITYDAADPGLRLVDVARVEVLKGPQGPLYGTGALGGVYRIVTHRPVLGRFEASAEAGGTGIATGGLGGQAEAMLNLPLDYDRAALRLVAYADAEPGWINDTGLRGHANQSLTSGGRASLRIAPAAGWTIDLDGVGQWIDTRDSQYVERQARDLSRAVAMLEPRDSSLIVAKGSATGPIGAVQLTIAASHAWQDQADSYDASDSAAAFGIAGGRALFRDQRQYRLFDQEVRLASAPGSHFAWTAGVSYVSAITRATGDIAVPGAGGVPARVFALYREITEAAAFADGSLPITGRLTGELGVRVFRSTSDDERRNDAAQASSAKARLGVTPSLSLSYRLASGNLVYARIGSAFRPGGADPTNTRSGRFDGDEVRSFDLGARLRSRDGRIAFDGGVFRTAWLHVQSDYLQDNGLVATHNVGDADILGLEGTFDLLPGDRWRVRLGGTIQRARLVRGVTGADLPLDPRLPLVPDIAGRGELSRAIPLRRWTLEPYVAGTVRGATRLSFDPGLDRRMGAFAVARLGMNAVRGATRLRLELDNLLDTRADSFAFGNPFSILTHPQYTPIRPRTLSFSLARQF